MMPAQIAEVFAFVMADDAGNEGIAAMIVGHTVMPLVGADQARVDSLWPYARALAEAQRRPVTLIRFRERYKVITYDPGNPR